jgi:ABC-type phosphate transport system auxiliary subunit
MGRFVLSVITTSAWSAPVLDTRVHYTGHGAFMVSGKIISQKKLFPRGML